MRHINDVSDYVCAIRYLYLVLERTVVFTIHI